MAGKVIMARKNKNCVKAGRTEKDCLYTGSENTFVKNLSMMAAKSDGALETLAEDADDFVYAVDSRRKIVLVFGKRPAHLNISSKDIIGRNYEILATSGSVLFHRIACENAFNGEAVTYEWFLETSKDTSHYRSSLMPIFGKDNRVISVIGCVRHISKSIKTKASSMVADGGIKSFSKILLAIREEEKRKISLALHDELGSLGVSLSSLLGIVEADIRDNRSENAIEGLKKIKRYADDFTEKIKEIAMKLRPPNLDTVGLVGSLKDVIALASRFCDTNITFDCKIPESTKVDDYVRISLYRVVQESLNNIMKHSKAKNAKISLESKGNSICLTVTDDGIGFNYDKNKSIKLRNIGILGMRESVDFMGGKFELKSMPGKGTTISVVCPLACYVVEV